MLIVVQLRSASDSEMEILTRSKLWELHHLRLVKNSVRWRKLFLFLERFLFGFRRHLEAGRVMVLV